MKAWTIVGYTFNADIYCPDCIIAALPTGEGGAFDGWALGEGIRMETEDNLNQIAAAFGIDRTNEASFDSGDFPKVIFSSDTYGWEVCDSCRNPIAPWN